MTLAAVVLIAISSCFLFAYGTNLIYLSVRAARLPRPVAPEPLLSDEPRVAVQLPIYNERYVAARVIDAAARLDWPRDRIEVQVLDDSDDETVAIVAARVAHWRARGVSISQLRRAVRTGYKAGALAAGLAATDAELIAIFDADFLPAPDFLRRSAGALSGPRVGFVQARWTHLNRDYSIFTRLQSLMVDFHFWVEQSVRPSAGYLTNFTGTAGLWRRAAIEAAGGWSADTLTEDLDLSYRAQLAGWRAVFLEGLAVPQELPVAVNAYRGQQSRWATGSFQTAIKLLPSVLRSGRPASHKFQATMHLLAYLAPALMLLQLACYPLLLLAKAEHDPLFGAIRVPILVNLLSLAPTLGFAIAQRRAGGRWALRLPGILAWSFVGAGTSATVVAALARAFRRGGVFKRTPKFRIEARDEEWRDHAYVRASDPAALAELLLGTCALALCIAAVVQREWLIAFYSLLFSFGFLYLSLYSAIQALEVLTVRRLGRDALASIRARGPLLLLLAAPAALLIALAQWPDPFEDSFQHWLLAANLVQTGHLADPLFGMQDTWLPAYTFFAAAVLRVAGWHQMGALKLANVGLALATLAIVRKLAPTPRQGALAVLLLALNPIFLLTATSAVAEPLLLLALTASAASLLARRHALAASWAVIGCLTGTKAWLWLFCAVAVLAGGALLSRRRPAVAQRLAWAMPAVAVLLVLQLTAGQASHSVARAAQEVGSAVARGDLNPDPAGRALSFLGYFLLASLPLVVLAPLGIRTYLAGGTAAKLRLIILPGLLYLGVVTALVFAGIYSGKQPDRIFGSRDLPAGQLAATGWLQQRMVGAVVTEDIGYYRLTAVFPELVRGAPVAPFRPLGSEAAYTVPGGKRAFAYSLQPERFCAWVTDSALAEIGPAEQPRVGKTAGLAKGLVLETANGLLAGEGMGFGVPLVRYPDGDYFGGSATVVDISTPEQPGWVKTFELDRLGVDSDRSFLAVATRGQVEVTYRVGQGTVDISVKAPGLDPGFEQVVVLNEESSRFDDFADPTQTRNGSAIGPWRPVEGDWGRYRSGSVGLEWSLPRPPTAIGMYAARETRSPDIDFSGIEYVFGPGFTGVDYQLTVSKAR
ncbi:MAG TPA: glycosyltransferase [Candidatus Dormibacteraeota bacterium]